jgi:drug/metabolite transporter (DMT)-like permease
VVPRAPGRPIRAGRRPRWKVHVALAGAQTGFALFPIFGKLALAAIPPLVFASIRVVTSALLLALASRLAGADRIEPRDRGRMFVFALLGVSLNQVLFIVGLSMTTAIHTTILMASIPVFTLAAASVLRHETPSARAFGGMILAATGAVLLVNAQGFDWQSRYVRGDLLLLLNCLSYSLYLVLSRPILARYTPLTFVSAMFRYGAVPIVLVSLPELLRFSPAAVPPKAWTSLAAIVLFSTAIPYLLNSWALARTDASRVAAYVFFQPLIASVLAMQVLGERLGWTTAIAAALILSGLALSLKRARLPLRPPS